MVRNKKTKTLVILTMTPSRVGTVAKKDTQIEYRTRIRENKPMTWRNKKAKSNFHSKKDPWTPAPSFASLPKSNEKSDAES